MMKQLIGEGCNLCEGSSVKASAVYRSNIVAFEEFNALWLMLRCASIPVTKPANRMFMSVVSSE